MSERTDMKERPAASDQDVIQGIAESFYEVTEGTAKECMDLAEIAYNAACAAGMVPPRHVDRWLTVLRETEEKAGRRGAENEVLVDAIGSALFEMEDPNGRLITERGAIEAVRDVLAQALTRSTHIRAGAKEASG